MATFQFDHNIGDVVCYRFQNDEGTCGGTIRGVIRTIIVGDDTYGYTIETVNGTDYVNIKDVVRAVYSTKSFDVMYPGIEVNYFRFGRDEPPVLCLVEAAYIERGRLYYRVRDCNMNAFIAPEGNVEIVKGNQYNPEYFD